jgi:hypothetical protein
MDAIERQSGVFSPVAWGAHVTDEEYGAALAS